MISTATGKVPVLNLEEIIKATGATPTVPISNPEILKLPVLDFSTDTRTLAEGALLFALRGERFDAHDHLSPMVFSRACAVVISRPGADLAIPAETLALRVPDTLRALGQTATAWALRCADFFEQQHDATPAVRVGLCGSSGKTTTKEMLADIFAGTGISAYVTPGNLNNLIGLPKTMLALTPDHQVAVLELGMNLPGEARDLVRIARPTTLLLTNINNAHVGMFGTLEDLYQAEADSLRYAPADCTLVINQNDPQSRRAEAEFAKGRSVVRIAPLPDSPECATADWSVREVSRLAPYGYGFEIVQQATGTSARVELRLFGAHNISNALAAAALACDPRCGVGARLTDVADALSAFRPRLNRSEVEEFGGWWVIKDFYNAVPAAVEAALASMADVHIPGRRFALLSEMRELGDLHEACHLAVGQRAAASALDHLFTVGERARLIHDEALRCGVAGATHFATKDEAVQTLRGLLQPGDLLLIKGARLVGLETVYQDLTGRDAHIH